MNRVLTLCGFLIFAIACGDTMEFKGSVPNDKVATIDGNTIRLSRGIAMALTCKTWDNDPCTTELSSADPNLVEVYQTAELERAEDGARRLVDVRSTFVVVGRDVGKTRLRMLRDDYTITIVDD